MASRDRSVDKTGQLMQPLGSQSTDGHASWKHEPPVRRDALKDRPLDELNRPVLVCGPAVEALGLLPDGCVQTVVTSSPYWSLRGYEAEVQMGRDDSLSEYVKGIVTVFDQVRRVLVDDGTVWLNVGDSYISGDRRYRAPDRRRRARETPVCPPTLADLKPKDLLGIPWRLALALQQAGWWLRSEVIWYKPNARPESVTDRPTKSHETVFLLSKSQNYYYDAAAVKGPSGRRLRTMWDFNVEPRTKSDRAIGDHSAVMPTALARRCIQITSRPGDVVLDPYSRTDTTFIAAQELGRNWAGIDLNLTDVDLIEHRASQEHDGLS